MRPPFMRSRLIAKAAAVATNSVIAAVPTEMTSELNICSQK